MVWMGSFQKTDFGFRKDGLEIASRDAGFWWCLALQKQDSRSEQSEGKQGDGGPIWAMNQGLMDSAAARDITR